MGRLVDNGGIVVLTKMRKKMVVLKPDFAKYPVMNLLFAWYLKGRLLQFTIPLKTYNTNTVVETLIEGIITFGIFWETSFSSLRFLKVIADYQISACIRFASRDFRRNGRA